MRVLDENRWIMIEREETNSGGLITNESIGLVVSSPDRKLNGLKVLFNEGATALEYNNYIFIDIGNIFAVIK
jgi:hypothetical protein